MNPISSRLRGISSRIRSTNTTYYKRLSLSGVRSNIHAPAVNNVLKITTVKPVFSPLKPSSFKADARTIRSISPAQKFDSKPLSPILKKVEQAKESIKKAVESEKNKTAVATADLSGFSGSSKFILLPVIALVALYFILIKK
jgi:hypothetical protein